MMVVDVTTGANFEAGRPRVLYTGEAGLVAPDGQHFLSVLGGKTERTREIELIIDCFPRSSGETQ